jgi:hypothetical protein
MILILLGLSFTERVYQTIAFPSFHEGVCLYNPQEFGGSKTVGVFHQFIVYEHACSTASTVNEVIQVKS